VPNLDLQAVGELTIECCRCNNAIFTAYSGSGSLLAIIAAELVL